MKKFVRREDVNMLGVDYFEIFRGKKIKENL